MYKLFFCALLSGSTLLAAEPLSFAQALDRKLAIDAGLSSLSHQRAALKLNVEVTNAIAPTGLETVFEDLGQDEIEISVSQEIDLPSIRRKRRALVSSKILVLDADVQTYHHQIRAELNAFFLDAILTHRQLSLSHDRIEVLKKMEAWQSRQFQEGALAESELIRTQLALAEMISYTDRIKATLDRIAVELSVYLETDIQHQQLPVLLPEHPSQEHIHSSWDQSLSAPAFQQQQARINLLEAEVKMAHRPMITSISLTGGYKILPELDEGFSVIGLALESPIFSKRAKAVKVQEHYLNSAKAESMQLQSQLDLRARQWQQDWAMAKTQLETLEAKLIPRAEHLYQKLGEEYRSGARAYLEVLDAQSLLYDFYEEAIELEFDLASQLLEMNQILGVSIYEFN